MFSGRPMFGKKCEIKNSVVDRNAVLEEIDNRAGVDQSVDYLNH